MFKAFKIPKISTIIVALLALFLLLFPKGGIKLNEKPFTIGYLLFFTFSYLLLFQKLSRFNRQYLKVLTYLFPFQLFSILSITVNGWENLIILVSFIIHFFVIPAALFIVFPRSLSTSVFVTIQKWLKNGVNFLAVFGVFLFFFKLFSGKFIEIPFLTVNYHDLHTLEVNKCIDRGGFFKLISTYNNGNLYGICLLMLYPVYMLLENRKLFKGIVILSLVLTLSRTVWIGLFFAEFLRLFSTSYINIKNIYKLVSALMFSFISILILQVFLHLPFSFFLDKTLGHRISQFEVLKTFSLIGKEPFSGIYEISYLGIYKSFGLLGLVSFLFAMIAPISSLFSKYLRLKNPLYRKLAEGLITYCFVSMSDGAILLIPVMTIYWLIGWIGLSQTEELSY